MSVVTRNDACARRREPSALEPMSFLATPLPLPRPHPNLHPAVLTTRGRRETNQDRVCALRSRVGDRSAVLLALADGIGGLPASERAAELAIEIASEYAHRVIPQVEPSANALRTALRELVRAASRAVRRLGEKSDCGIAGSTFVCALVWDQRHLVAHAGDSRCYAVDAHGARRLTEDHTEAQRLVNHGALDPSLASRSPLRHRLTNALGSAAADLFVDLVPASGEPAAVEEGSVLLVCSDGLHGALDERDLHEGFACAATPEEACQRLVALALERGSSDNVSIGAVEIGRLPRRPARPAGALTPS